MKKHLASIYLPLLVSASALYASGPSEMTVPPNVLETITRKGDKYTHAEREVYKKLSITLSALNVLKKKDIWFDPVIFKLKTNDQIGDITPLIAEITRTDKAIYDIEEGCLTPYIVPTTDVVRYRNATLTAIERLENLVTNLINQDDSLSDSEKITAIESIRANCGKAQKGELETTNIKKVKLTLNKIMSTRSANTGQNDVLSLGVSILSALEHSKESTYMDTLAHLNNLLQNTFKKSTTKLTNKDKKKAQRLKLKQQLIAQLNKKRIDLEKSEAFNTMIGKAKDHEKDNLKNAQLLAELRQIERTYPADKAKQLDAKLRFWNEKGQDYFVSRNVDVSIRNIETFTENIRKNSKEGRPDKWSGAYLSQLIGHWCNFLSSSNKYELLEREHLYSNILKVAASLKDKLERDGRANQVNLKRLWDEEEAIRKEGAKRMKRPNFLSEKSTFDKIASSVSLRLELEKDSKKPGFPKFKTVAFPTRSRRQKMIVTFGFGGVIMAITYVISTKIFSSNKGQDIGEEDDEEDDEDDEEGDENDDKK